MPAEGEYILTNNSTQHTVDRSMSEFQDFDFLKSQPSQGNDPELTLDTVADCIRYLRQHAAEVGPLLDVPEILVRLESAEQNLKRLVQLREELVELRLQLMADLADLKYILFKRAKSLSERLRQTAPSDPAIQELQHRLEEASRQFPKE